MSFPRWHRPYPYSPVSFGADFTTSSAAAFPAPAAPGAIGVGPSGGLSPFLARGFHPAPLSAFQAGSGAAAVRRAMALAELHRRTSVHRQVVTAQSRQAAIAQAASVGIATPIACRASFGPTWTCPLYSIVTNPDGTSDLSAPIARVLGGATGLYADLARPITFSPGVGLGVITVYRVVWIDGPNGPVYGYMPDGGFESNPAVR
jgi:hypothetical protein